MAFISTNPNPKSKNVGDCVVRALSIALNKGWRDVFKELSILCMIECDMPSSNRIWGEYLGENGFVRHSLADTCPLCYTVQDFCRDNPRGLYVLGSGEHAVTIIDGNYYDTWDSGDTPVLFYWTKER